MAQIIGKILEVHNRALNRTAHLSLSDTTLIGEPFSFGESQTYFQTVILFLQI
jgi:hypothetical protein